MSPHFERALLLYQQRRYEHAEKELVQVMASNPNDAVAHSLMGMCLLQRERFEEATEHAQQAIGLAPDVPFVHSTLARIWATRNHLDTAEAACDTAISLDPHDAETLTLRGHLHTLRKQWDPALKAAEEALAVDPDHVGALNLRAEALRGLGRTDTAVDQYEAALRADPENAWTHASVGWNYLEKGKRDKAMEHFREALRLDPELDWARAGVVEALKAWNPAYRLVLGYFFRMQRFSSQNQWMIILGLWFGYMLARNAVDAYPSLGIVLWPLIAIYVIFVLMTWLAVPLANLSLRLHPFGRLALSRDQRVGTNWIGGFLLGGVVAGVSCLIWPVKFTVYATIYCLMMLLPLGITFQTAKPWPRKGMLIYTLLVGLAGAAGVIGALVPVDTWKAWPALLAIPFGLATGLGLLVFPWGALLSVWAGNILATMRWKR